MTEGIERRDGADQPADFAPATRAWFSRAFSGPTTVQTRAWEVIGRGENALVIAPTGSGKTLAAFLSAIDRLGRGGTASGGAAGADDAAPSAGASGSGSGRKKGPARGVRVLYVSPLKALGADVERNLRRPLAGIAEAAAELGERWAPVSVGVRSGDTPARERRRLAAHPPEVLITTPESLYLMLTSKARESLRTVETVIVDEIHSFAGEKRGTHLALSLERLDDLLASPAQRVGLSATVSPREEIARFLGGTHPVTIVADDARTLPELRVAVPVDDMAHVPATEDRRTRMDRALAAPVRQGRSRDVAPARPGRGDGASAWRSDKALRRHMAGGGGAAGAGRAAGAVAGRAAAASHVTASIWPHIEEAVLDEVLAHRTTIVFVNSRGVCERLTAHLNEAYAIRLAQAARPLDVDGGAGADGAGPAFPPSAEGPALPALAGGPAFPPSAGGSAEDPWAVDPALHRESWEMGDNAHAQALPPEAPVIARAHHGSVSKEQRLEVERLLKAGELRCVVATASLELGIDMGSVDLVLQVAPPPSVASALQRVGRADHRVGGRPTGTLYPVQRTQLVDAAVVCEGVRAGRIEETVLVTNALDVLAQQTVAAASMGDLGVEDWYATVRRAAPYRDLPRRAYESVLELLDGAYATAELTDFAPRLTWDRGSGTLAARPGAQRLAVGASGTIPDRGMFPVVLPEGEADAGRRRVGELDEEMVNETAVGDVITLGTSSWRVREITGDRVIVDAAPGRSSRLPFWHGEGPGRPAATGAAKGAFLREVSADLPELQAVPSPGGEEVPGPLTDRLTEDGLDAAARRNLTALLREQRAATGVVPSDRTLVLERTQDEDGSWRLILHSPWGRRVHEPWAMAIRERARTLLGIEPQMVVADDGIVLQLPMTEETPPGLELVVLDGDEVTRLVTARIGETALFAARFRECAARALLMPAAQPGRRTPLWLQRLKAGQLLEASRQLESFPVSVEAARECLQDVYDLPVLAALLRRIAAGEVRVVDVTTESPSPFAGPLVFGYTASLLYQGDLPHAERTAHLLSLDPDVLAELMGDDGVAGLLDDDVLAQVEAELQRLAPERRARADGEGVADLLRELGPLSVEEVVERCAADGEEDAAAALDELAAHHRALQVNVGGTQRWARVEDAPDLHEGLGTAVPDWALERDAGTVLRVREGARSPLGSLVLRLVRSHAGLTAGDVADRLGLGMATARETLVRLADDDDVLRLGGQSERWMAPAVLRRVRNRSLARARSAIEPVPAETLQALVLERAGLDEPRSGAEGLAEVLAELEGVWLPAPLWEEVVLPARVDGYRPAMLDELLASGDVLWVGRSRREDTDGAPEAAASTSGPAGRPAASAGAAGTGSGSPAAPDEIAFLPSDSPFAPLDAGPADTTDPNALWDLALDGGATAASFEPVRRALHPTSRVTAQPARRVRSRRGRSRYGSLTGGRSLASALRDEAARAGQSESARGGRDVTALGGTAGSAVVATASVTAPLTGSAPGWRRLEPSDVTPEEDALALVESLLERYAVVSREVALAAGVPGGLGPLVPVLRRMEDTGLLLRGRFVAGLGPSQVAERETVDLLRERPNRSAGVALAAGSRPVVVDLKDPACLVGRAVPWPEPALPEGISDREREDTGAPARRQGASVVLLEGRPVLHATERLRALTSYTADRAVLEAALTALVQHERELMGREERPPRRVVENLGGVPALDRGVSALLAQAGLEREPRGMVLRPDPYGRR
ncbi:DEAD/DEAH box helicase [Actinomyces haliotis]|uniref:DEAD/DEAH box helicase n=1 Tax=Actinomyces haliotis TaxID=1280843 RepID=UPI002B279826|nr:DEAD/DEAH box helicase [Actinomyces haliotis]